MEKLLLVGALARSFLALDATTCTAPHSSVSSLLLNVLSRVGATCASHAPTPASRLGRSLVLPMQLHCLVLKIRCLVMQTTAILINMRASLSLFASIISLTDAASLVCAICWPVLNEALLSVARSLLYTAFKHVAMLDVLDFFIRAAGCVRPTVLRLALSDANVADVTVLVDNVRLLTASFLLSHPWYYL